MVLCWPAGHFTIKLSHLNAWDLNRLTFLSKGSCDGSNPDEALARAVAFAEAAFLAPLPAAAKKTASRGMKGRRQPKK